MDFAIAQERQTYSYMIVFMKKHYCLMVLFRTPSKSLLNDAAGRIRKRRDREGESGAMFLNKTDSLGFQNQQLSLIRMSTT
jgi:hypothetical protein